MPHMTGTDLAEAIIGIRPDTPVILCTGCVEILTSAKAGTNAFREILLKPFMVRDLATALRRVLDEGQVLNEGQIPALHRTDLSYT